MIINDSYTSLVPNASTQNDVAYNVNFVDENEINITTPPPDTGNLLSIKEAFAVAGLVVGPLGLIGNILTIIVLTNKTMRTSTNSYLTSLAVWDSIVIVASIFLIYLSNFLPMVMCAVQLIYPTALTAQTATIWITVSFTVERFIAVCHPLRAASMCTIRRARIVIFGVSVSALFYNLPRWFEFRFNKNNCRPEKTTFGTNQIFTNTYYNMMYPAVMCIVPLCVLSVMNIFLIRAVRRSSHQRADMNVRQSRENNVTIMLVSVVVVFIICQVPALVYNIAYAALQPDKIQTIYGFQVLSHFRNFLVVVNSTVNFLLYCAFGQKFRRTFVRLVCWRWLPENLGRQHSFSHVSNTTPGAPPAVKQRNSGNKQYYRIPNKAHSPQHTEKPPLGQRNSSGTTTSSSKLSKDSLQNKNYIIKSAEIDDDFIDASKPIIEEYELCDLRPPDDLDLDNDSQDTVLRQLIPDTEAFCVYRVDFNKYKNGTVV